MDAMVKEFETLYEEMAEAKAEGSTAGYTEKLLGCRCLGSLGYCELHGFFLMCSMHDYNLRKTSFVALSLYKT